MRKNFLIGSFLGLFLIAVPSFAEVIIQIAPPVAIVETPPPAPSRRHVWVVGYHRWDGHGYVWVPGHWAVPPHPHMVWVPHHWKQRHGQWVLVEGHWR